MKLFNLTDKVAIITGGNGGIGFAMAKAIGEAGATVVIAGRNETKNKKSIEELNSLEIKCKSLTVDVVNENSCNKLIEDVAKEFGKLNILINNAGAVWGEPLHKFSEDGWDKVMDLNVKSIFFMIQKFLDLLKKNTTSDNPARIINIGSIDGINTPYYENYSYSIAKSAVHKLTSVLAAKLIKDNIICNAIAPGPFPSKMLGSAVEHDYSVISKKNPSGRVGMPEDIAGLAIFLASRAGQYTVGETITCDGGLVASAGHDLTND